MCHRLGDKYLIERMLAEAHDWRYACQISDAADAFAESWVWTESEVATQFTPNFTALADVLQLTCPWDPGGSAAQGEELVAQLYVSRGRDNADVEVCLFGRLFRNGYPLYRTHREILK